MFANRGVRALLFGISLLVLGAALVDTIPILICPLFLLALILFAYAFSILLMYGWLRAADPVPLPKQMRLHPDDPSIVQQYRQGQWVTISQKQGRFAVQKYSPHVYGWVNIFDYRSPHQPPPES